MEHETFFALMMDALDGELADDGRSRLESHLRACPPCMQEWTAITAVDTLFRQATAVNPPVGFAERTLEALPNRQLRVLTMGILYMMLLFSGILPLLLGGLAVTVLRPSLDQPGVWESLWQSAVHIVQVIGTVFGALLISVGDFIGQYPAVLGWALVMAGVVSLWSGVLRHLAIPQPRQMTV
jgi:anti-sigma factor RsiW